MVFVYCLTIHIKEDEVETIMNVQKEPEIVEPEEPPLKKVKIVKEVDPDVIRKTREAKAEKLREEMALEQRVEKFNELLDEHNISAFSTFERELSKLEKDDRFLLV